MQDFTGVPAVVDLAAMRDATTHLGADPRKINPLVPVDLVIDHSVMVDFFGSPNAFEKNVDLEYERNGERYTFLRWGQEAFENFRVVPPGTGICHQVNLEYLAQTVWTRDEREDGTTVTYAFPDTLVGTDSHTTMVNGLSVLGWGVGGIEAEAAMLGQPISMLIPEVIGFRIDGKLPEGTTATDLVLTVTQMLRKKGVVGKFVEFYGPGLSNLTVEDRATIGNMAPEYGATCGLFPIERDTITYLTATGRDPDRVALVEAYAKAQGMWRDGRLGRAGLHRHARARPRHRRAVARRAEAAAGPRGALRRRARSSPKAHAATSAPARPKKATRRRTRNLRRIRLDGHVVIAAITSCTNTSNPSVLIGAGLLAKKAHEKGLKPKPWVKTSLAPGSQVVTEYLEKAGLQEHLDALGFNLVGYGCTTCIGNSGPLPEAISEAINDERPRRLLGALRQPQFRGPRQSGRARELPRLAAARRRLCARRLAQGRHHARAARHGPGRQAGLPQGHLADLGGDRRADPPGDHAGNVPRPLRRRLQGRRATGGRSRSRAASPTTGRTVRPMCRTRPTSPT